MRVILTGASGFVGTRLAHALVSANVGVVNVGRHSCLVPGVENVLVPALAPEHLAASLPSGFDGLIHLAAAGVKPSDRDVSTVTGVNSTLMPYLVSLASQRGIKAVVTVGSSAEYSAIGAHGPLDEESQLETHKLYGASKAAGGILALATGAASNVPVAVVRLFNVYGPGEAAHRLLPSLAAGLRAGQPVKLSAGTQIRDFVYVDDASNGLIAVLNALISGQLPSGAFNLATGVGQTVADFARQACEALGAAPELLQLGVLPMRPDDLPYVVGNPGKLQAACGWHTSTSLSEGIRRALAEI
ncbi:NAD-dependent epimerase/dehydratase family protein [Paraburkholderia terrae]|uniref:NAD-dependent epimerase/dehydratase family protein n=1 Tax=Paraburkholderia terrae TaxID=311230 RepID=UPI001319F565|nr:NAD(P)-dependent oxidoreductase [Paraburkholderia terrae]